MFLQNEVSDVKRDGNTRELIRIRLANSLYIHDSLMLVANILQTSLIGWYSITSLLLQAFAMIDQDRDGIIGSDDLAAIYNQIGTMPRYIIINLFG